MKRTFVINWILIDLFIVSVISWFRPHVTGRGNSHEIWQFGYVSCFGQCAVPCCHNIPYGNTLGLI